MATEDRRLQIQVADHEQPNTSPIGAKSRSKDAFQFAYDVTMWDLGRFSVKTTRQATEDIITFFSTDSIDAKSAEVLVNEVETSNFTVQRTLARGVVEDIQFNATSVKWVCGDWTWALQDAEPFVTPSGDIDADISGQSILDLDNSDPQAGSLSRAFAHREPHDYLRDAAQHGGYERRPTTNTPDNGYELYNVGSMGTDRGTTLGPSHGNVAGIPEFSRADRDATALAVIGGDDPNTSNERYHKQALLSHGSSADWREIWHVVDDPGLQSQTEVDDQWAKVADDIESSNERRDIKLTAVDLDHIPRLGDAYEIDLPGFSYTVSDASDPEFRVVERGMRLDEGEERYPLVISNRDIARPDRERDDLVALGKLQGSLGQ